ncbi:MAG: chromate transporter [Novosphingobium sp. 16-62-11]|nr:MAG: chromate transporter [Novosphingobium sp. 16-62-11]
MVDERQWVDEEQYLHALNFCHLLPGPEAQQLATWIGWKLHGLRGGLAAGLLFVLPGALVILALTALYAVAADLDWFAAVFLGIKAAVLAIVVQALLRIAGRALNTGFKRGLSVAAFFALFAFNAPFPLVVLGAGAIGMVVAAARPDWLALKPGNDVPLSTPRPWGQSIRTVLIWGAIWARAPEPFSPLVAGLLGALLTTWVTFAPCFLWIFTFAPWIERMENSPRLKGGLAAVTAAVVGVIANLTAWFFIHVLFSAVIATQIGPMHLNIPVWTSFDWRAAMLAAMAAMLLFKVKWSIIGVLAAAAAGGLILGLST